LVIALLALKRTVLLGFSSALKAALVSLLIIIMRISLAAKLLSYETLAINMDTLVLANRVKCVVARVLAINAYN
jgi:hypothetical protein